MPSTLALCISGERIGERVAQHVPRQAREHMPAHPLHGRQSQRQHQHAARPLAPKAGCNGGRRSEEQGKAGGQQGDGQGEQHGKGLGFDEKRFADPEQAGQEVAEAEPPADRGGGDDVCTAWCRGSPPSCRRRVFDACRRRVFDADAGMTPHR